MKYPKRLIEVDLTNKRIVEYTRREKSIRHNLKYSKMDFERCLSLV